jgi:addiction module HigA family antidote
MISRRPTHPGVLLREDVLPASSIDQNELASKLSISNDLLSDIMNGRAPVNTDIAHGLGKVFGNDPGLWLRMQRAFDAWEDHSLDPRIARCTSDIPEDEGAALVTELDRMKQDDS